MSIKGAVFDVETFHVAGGLPVREKPLTWWCGDDIEGHRLRQDLIAEEHQELQEAMDKIIDEDDDEANMVAIADGLADLIYVCIGTALNLGINLERVWDAVHASNMAKVKGGVVKRDDGKILKPKGWEPPDIHAAVYGK